MKFTLSKYYWLFNVLLFSGLGCFSYLFLVIYSDLPSRSDLDLLSVQVFGGVIAVSNGIGISLIQINRKLKKDVLLLFNQKYKLLGYAVLLAGLLLALNYLLLTTVKWAIDVPDPFYMKWSGIRMLFTIWLVELVVVSLTLTNNFYRHILMLYHKTAQLEESSVKAQYTALQNQLNPHFLFNSLNTLISEIEYNPANAVLFTRNLSDVYRYILQCQQYPLVSLRSELDFLSSYIFLHQVRLGDCIHLDNRIYPDMWEMKLPPLTLQLLAENVIKHNTIYATKPMTIILSYLEKESMLVVENEIRPKKCIIESGMGLKNLTARYQLICDRNIIVSDSNHCFTVKVPLLNE